MSIACFARLYFHTPPPYNAPMLTSQFHDHFMRLALREAEKAAAAEEVPAGCIIVQKPQGPDQPLAAVKVLARAHNQTEMLKDATAHAEMIALTQASAALGDWRLTGTILYVTKEPCPMCAGAIVHSRIRKVLFGATEPKAGAVVSTQHFFCSEHLNHKVETEKGILEAECRNKMQDFFRKKRV